MMRFITLIFLVLFSLNSTFAQWKSMGSGSTPNESQNLILDVHAVNENIVWATILKASDFSPNQTFLKTIDGGRTITTGTINVEDTSLSTFGIFAFDEMTAWVTMVSEPCQCYGNIFKTIDGGETWTKELETDLEQSPLDIHFLNENDAFILCSDGTGSNSDKINTIISSDGGETWTDTTPLELEAGEGQWIGSLNGNLEIIGDNIWFGTRNGRIFRSIDKGITWGVTAPSISPRNIGTIAFKDSLNGIAASGINTAGFPATNQAWKTSNGGTTWTEIAIPERPTANSLEYIPGTEDTYLLSGGWNNSGAVVTTTGGEYWTELNVGSIVGSHFISPTVGFSGGYIQSNDKEGLLRFISSFEKEHVNVKQFAGNYLEGYATGNKYKSNLYNPKGMDMDADGNLYIANASASTVVKVGSDGQLDLLAGLPDTLLTRDDVDGLASEARFARPQDILIDKDGNLLVADLFSGKIRKITFQEDSSEPIVSTFAGTGEIATIDGSIDTAAFEYCTAIVKDEADNLYVSTEYNIRKITPEGIVSTFVGSEEPGSEDGIGTAAKFNVIWGMDIDSSGNLYVMDYGNNAIRKVTPEGVVTTLAGGRGQGYADGQGTNALFLFPEGLAVTKDGTVYIGDGANGFVRKIDSLGNVTTIAGTMNNYTWPGDVSPKIIDGDSDIATFGYSRGMYVKADGNLLHSSYADGIRELQFGIPSAQLSFTNTTQRKYGTYHINHTEAIQIKATAHNHTDWDAIGASVKATIRKDGRLKFVGTSPRMDVLSNSKKVLELESTFTPDAVGEYEVELEYFLEGEKLDTKYDLFTVSDSLMSYDDGYPSDFLNFDQFIDNFTHGYGTSYTLDKQDTLTGIEVFLFSDGTEEELNALQFFVWRMNEDGTQVTEPIYTSEFIETPAAYFGSYTYIIEDDNIILEPGNYLIGLQSFNPIFLGFDHSGKSDKFQILDPATGEWTRIYDLWGGFEEPHLMMHPVLNEIPTIVNVSNPIPDIATIKTFPNPFVDEIQIHLSKPQHTTVSLVDIQGRIVQRQTINGTSTTLKNLEGLPKGTYFMHFNNGEFRQVKAITKQ